MIEQPVSLGTRLLETSQQLVLDLNSVLRNQHS
jgi:hypothetical protein